ncbi:putative phage tail protein [Lachnospiraceae bacterium 62-35]
MAVNLMPILPQYFRPVLEFQELMEAYGTVLNELEKNINQVWDNIYIQTCDEETVKMYELQFGITASPWETLEYRRQRILQKFNTIVPFSIEFLEDRLTELFGQDYTLSIDPAACRAEISITSDRYGAVDLLYDLILDVVPAHLEIVSNQQVTNYISDNIYAAEVMTGALIQKI